jgi:hypothetical protein
MAVVYTVAAATDVHLDAPHRSSIAEALELDLGVARRRPHADSGVAQLVHIAPERALFPDRRPGGTTAARGHPPSAGQGRDRNMDRSDDKFTFVCE